MEKYKQYNIEPDIGKGSYDIDLKANILLICK